MKKYLLGFLLLSTVAAQAQKFEYGFGGGISGNSQPTGNMYYVGDKSALNYAGGLWALYNSWSGWQLGLNIHELELASTSSTVYTDAKYPTITYGGDDKKFVYGAYTTSIVGFANKKLIQGSSDLYMGFAMGWALAKNDPNNRTANESYKAPDNGNGLVLGMQFGYTINFNPLFGLNLEVAPRYYDLHYSVTAPHVNTYSNLNYQIWAFPFTLGFRFRLESADRGNPLYDYEKYRRHNQRYFRRLFKAFPHSEGAAEVKSKAYYH